MTYTDKQAQAINKLTTNNPSLIILDVGHFSNGNINIHFKYNWETNPNILDNQIHINVNGEIEPRY